MHHQNAGLSPALVFGKRRISSHCASNLEITVPDKELVSNRVERENLLPISLTQQYNPFG